MNNYKLEIPKRDWGTPFKKYAVGDMLKMRLTSLIFLFIMRLKDVKMNELKFYNISDMVIEDIKHLKKDK